MMRVLARFITLGSLGLFLGAAPSAFAQDPNAYPPQQQPQQPAPQQPIPQQPVPQQQYPQQQYPQQQYPQQQYPQQQYPQQQYPQQQYPQQQYPQQQTYPPAGYAAPAPPGYQPAYVPLPPPAYTDLRHGGLAILTLGLNLPMGKGADRYSTGASLGTLLGGHITHNLSLNGEFSINILNATNAPSTESEAYVDFAFSPLFHFGQGNIEFAIGPKIGAFGYALTYEGSDNKASKSGYAYGVNAAAFFQITPSMAIGGLLNYTGRNATKACSTYNGSESCRDSTTNDDMDMVTINGALRW